MKHRRRCLRCWWALIKDEKAMSRWLAQVLGGQFQYRWSVRDEQGRKGPEPFRYIHPDEGQRWLEEGPCKTCPCQAHCDEVCALRASWWDARMEQLRRQLGVRGKI